MSDNPNSSIQPEEETVFLPFGTKKPLVIKTQLRNIVFIGIILVLIFTVYLISGNTVFSLTNETIELEIIESTVEYDTSSTINELSEIDELLNPLEEEPDYQSTSSNQSNNWEFYGVIGISKTTYKSDETVKFIIKDLAKDDSGQIIIKRPGGEVYKIIDYDGSINSFHKFEFIPEYELIKKCPECTFGFWKISMNSFQGNYNQPIYFKVEK